ncbi:MAG: thiamine phosphate synthase [Candidatus Auribacterota bacterium]|nr:thiamine phosphate synthase [Candidatus Auribacterota bacterium]
MGSEVTRKLNKVYSKVDSSVMGDKNSPITPPESFGLYAILTDPVVGYEACARAVVFEGVRYLQLRMKGADRAEVLRTARTIREITRGTHTRFIVNDDPLIAMEVDADGVHLGQSDMSLLEARALWDKPGKIFGLSTHNEAQEINARDLQPDYIGVGPVFPTPTKVIPDPDLGLELMGRIIRKSPLPAVAIGGINEENLPDVLVRGVVNFASVRPIMSSTDPRGVIRSLMDIWKASL